MVKIPPKEDTRLVRHKNQKESGLVQFEEDGEIIEMEIDDGGEAARQFASDDEENNTMLLRMR